MKEELINKMLVDFIDEKAERLSVLVDLQNLIKKIVAEVYDEAIKTSNSGRKMYEMGREDIRKELLEKLPRTMDDLTNKQK